MSVCACGCSSSLLWVHCAVALLLLVMAVAFMSHFSNNILLDYDEEVQVTILIPRRPHSYCLCLPHCLQWDNVSITHRCSLV